mgnify:CR=1 FL=1
MCPVSNSIRRTNQSIRGHRPRFEDQFFLSSLLQHDAWASLSKGNQLDLHQRIARATEKLEFWRGRLKELDNNLIQVGGKVASPETIRVGDLVYFHGWLPVVRVNKKTVTVSHWLGIASMTYKIEYTKIKDVKQKPATEASES